MQKWHTWRDIIKITVACDKNKLAVSCVDVIVSLELHSRREMQRGVSVASENI